MLPRRVRSLSDALDSSELAAHDSLKDLRLRFRDEELAPTVDRAMAAGRRTALAISRLHLALNAVAGPDGLPNPFAGRPTLLELRRSVWRVEHICSCFDETVESVAALRETLEELRAQPRASASSDLVWLELLIRNARAHTIRSATSEWRDMVSSLRRSLKLTIDSMVNEAIVAASEMPDPATGDDAVRELGELLEQGADEIEAARTEEARVRAEDVKNGWATEAPADVAIPDE